MGYPPRPAGWGTPPASWMGYPPQLDGVPPPGCELTHKLKTLPPLVLRTRSVKIKQIRFHISFKNKNVCTRTHNLLYHQSEGIKATASGRHGKALSSIQYCWNGSSQMLLIRQIQHKLGKNSDIGVPPSHTHHMVRSQIVLVTNIFLCTI